jgi:hypothetical protein
MSVVDVELLVVPDCPNESGVLSVLRLAFDRVDLAALPGRARSMPAASMPPQPDYRGAPPLGDVINALSAAHIVVDPGVGLKALRPLRGRTPPEP